MMAQTQQTAVTTRPVRTARDLDRFIDLPGRLAEGDRNFITPLRFERRQALSASTNPFFDHAEVQMWLALRGERVVGRISAQIDALAPQDSQRPAGHFGMIAAEDDPAVFAALFAQAEAWLASRGCVRALGPFNLSVNEEVGLLVDGFDTPPMLLMGHDPPYAGSRVEALGYAKAKDVYAYLCQMTDDLPPAVLKRVRRGPPAGVVLRRLDMKRLEHEVETLTEILNEAWSDNWGFTPTTAAETRQLAKSLRDVIDPRLTWFAEIDGEAAGFMVALPNVNEAIADLGGRILPFGWAKLLWRLKVARVKTLRAPLMGVKRKFAATLAGQLLPFHLIDAVATEARKLGYQQCELSWILDDNLAMRRICDVAGARIYKTYRIYEKALAA
jgi:GNAT superfamily N-acetyltransferase